VIKYTHKISSRSRSFRLRVEPSGEVIVSTPRWVSQREIERFVENHTAWIAQAQAKVRQNKKSTVSDAEAMIFGKTYTLKINSTSSSRIGVQVAGTELLVTSASLEPTPTQVKTQVNRFLKSTAEKYIVPRTHQLGKKMKISFGTITMREQKTRWGSCSSQGNLNFNWRLVHYAPAIIDYVIIHELAHRTHMDHSASFWALVAKYDSEYQQHRRWLKNHGLSVG
jgi:predicted metal-dependent hydrolase